MIDYLLNIKPDQIMIQNLYCDIYYSVYEADAL